MIYTAITAGKDGDRTDVKVFCGNILQGSGRLNAKAYKILSHLFVEGDSIWVDGNITLRVQEYKALELLSGFDMVIFRHPYRKCVSEELCVIYQLQWITKQTADEFMLKYPDVDSYGLYEGGVIMRNTSKTVERFNEIWWSLICRWCIRDQITLPIAIRQVPELKVNVIECNVREHGYFTYHPHAIPTTATA